MCFNMSTYIYDILANTDLVISLKNLMVGKKILKKCYTNNEISSMNWISYIALCKL